MTPAPTDDALMHDVAAGDLAKLGLLFERHHRAVHAFFGRLTGSGPAADDLTQEVFMRILRYRTTWRGDAPFTAWMFRIAHRAAADHHARSARAATAPLEVEPESGAPTPERAAESSERAERLRRSFARLAPEKRELLLLARFHELPHVEIAAILGCTVGAVKVRVHRALAELRGLLDATPAAGDLRGHVAGEARP